ncbi:alkaline phosphatase family protein [Undibacterium sp. MH2W]|uniref:alkaline phosphatase family protein n=1 Tax=Undibacterium sp. MH2W TaxID=3413044 RepID=UPI003BF36128
MKPTKTFTYALAGLISAASLLLAACSGGSTSTPPPPLGVPTTSASNIKHVFVIMLENHGYSDTFGTSTQNPYMQKTLVPQGALLSNYYGTGHVSLDNYVSLLSGQAATPDTINDCVPGGLSKLFAGAKQQFLDVNQTGTTSDGQVIASGGCVYPASVKTLPDQLVAAGLTWKGYMEDMGNDPAREPAGSCGHPTSAPVGSSTIVYDPSTTSEAPSAAVPYGDAYATRHNPFPYFHSLDATCNVVGLPTYIPTATTSPAVAATTPGPNSQLAKDLSSYSTTPNLVFITPNLCNDGHDGDGTGKSPCANGQPGGLKSADAFLQYWIPIIQASPAYQQDGMIVITFDEGESTNTFGFDANKLINSLTVTYPGAICCNQQAGPNLASSRPTTYQLSLPQAYASAFGLPSAAVSPSGVNLTFAMNNYGGDNVGAIVLSPFVKPGSVSTTPYNHYSLLRSLEQIFKVNAYLGYANDSTLQRIGDDAVVFK